jgi:hypothetical protein
MCAVVNLVKTCCFEGAAYTLRPGPREAHGVESSADQPGHRQDRCHTYSPCQRDLCAERKARATRRSTTVWIPHPRARHHEAPGRNGQAAEGPLHQMATHTRTRTRPRTHRKHPQKHPPRHPPKAPTESAHQGTHAPTKAKAPTHPCP